MRKVTTRLPLFILALLCLGQNNAFAVDPVFNLSNADICEDSAVMIDVSVSDFTIITSFQFTLGWDPTIIQLSEVINVNEAINTSILFGNFTEESSKVAVNWLDLSTEGITLDDDAILFTLSFNGVGDNSSVSVVDFFVDDPAIREVTARIDGASPTEVATTWNNGMVMVSQPELMGSQVADDVNMGGKGAIDITITNGTAPYSYAWSNGVDTEDLVDVAMGEYDCMVTDAKGCESEVGPFMVGNTTNTKEIDGLVNVNLFPNPTAGKVNLKAELEYNQDIQIIVYNFLGEKVYFNQIESANIELDLDLSNLASGNYLVQLRSSDGMYVEKVQLHR